jgi:hypothetical protein
MRAGADDSVAPLRVAVGLLRFTGALLAALLRLVRESAGRPDPIALEPRVLQDAERQGDGP